MFTTQERCKSAVKITCKWLMGKLKAFRSQEQMTQNIFLFEITRTRSIVRCMYSALPWSKLQAFSNVSEYCLLHLLYLAVYMCCLIKVMTWMIRCFLLCLTFTVRVSRPDMNLHSFICQCRKNMGMAKCTDRILNNSNLKKSMCIKATSSIMRKGRNWGFPAYFADLRCSQTAP